MQYLEVSGTPVVYIGRTVLKIHTAYKRKEKHTKTRLLIFVCWNIYDRKFCSHIQVGQVPNCGIVPTDLMLKM
jgi:hypothetical protein